MPALVLTAALHGCLGFVVHPDLYCPGEIAGETIEERLADVTESCATMIRVTIPSCYEDCG